MYRTLLISGDYDAEVTPVPIPNTVVKLCSADGTWREAARESRSLPEQNHKGFYSLCDIYSSLAQSVEHAAVNRVVVGSSPTGGAKNRHSSTEECRFYLLHIHFSLFPKKTCRFLKSNK